MNPDYSELFNRIVDGMTYLLTGNKASEHTRRLVIAYLEKEGIWRDLQALQQKKQP